ncbi:hypothetical protein ACOACO_18520 [Nocardioides sp. CPCC 205120]|uniref:hypothetical protein n=1 Tax=Nocardioides sp. CPCC 205120 TaxID=3406462 RepID=UPI003B51448E
MRGKWVTAALAAGAATYVAGRARRAAVPAGAPAAPVGTTPPAPAAPAVPPAPERAPEPVVPEPVTEPVAVPEPQTQPVAVPEPQTQPVAVPEPQTQPVVPEPEPEPEPAALYPDPPTTPQPVVPAAEPEPEQVAQPEPEPTRPPAHRREPDLVVDLTPAPDGLDDHRAGHSADRRDDHAAADGDEDDRPRGTGAALAGFYVGMACMLVVPVLYLTLVSWVFESGDPADAGTAARVAPYGLLLLVVPLVLVALPRTRRFGLYVLLGLAVTAVVVVSVAALVLWGLMRLDA